LPVVDLPRKARHWLDFCDSSNHSIQTIGIRRFVLEKLHWFAQREKFTVLGVDELREFMSYLRHGHEDPEGRWGVARLKSPIRPTTIYTYYGHLLTFFDWLTETEMILDESPMSRVAEPLARADQIQPFSLDQIDQLLSAARRSKHPRRDVAIVMLLLDTGIRATELCELKRSNVDFDERQIRVLGKGNKFRRVPFSAKTRRAIIDYLHDEPREEGEVLFYSERGTQAGEALTRSGLGQLIERLGLAAGVKAVRCSPHTFRHTFAVEFLRGGGQTLSLQEMLGHEALDMVKRYVRLAQSDIQQQHQKFSPVDRLTQHQKRGASGGFMSSK
jgi:integrase/recombinase XerC/integrase/recombinase XerD